jgi:hypothetical protein
MDEAKLLHPFQKKTKKSCGSEQANGSLAGRCGHAREDVPDHHHAVSKPSMPSETQRFTLLVLPHCAINTNQPRLLSRQKKSVVQ